MHSSRFSRPGIIAWIGNRLGVIVNTSVHLGEDGSRSPACGAAEPYHVLALRLGMTVMEHIMERLPDKSGVTMQANVGNYETSARFYIRALSMNPKAASTWGYLRTSLACSGRMDLMELVHESNLDALQKELPL